MVFYTNIQKFDSWVADKCYKFGFFFGSLLLGIKNSFKHTALIVGIVKKNVAKQIGNGFRSALTGGIDGHKRHNS